MLHKIKPLHYYTSPILPTIYSDELSYLEADAKTNYKLNEVIEEVNEVTEAVEELQDEVDALDNRLDEAEEDINTLQTNLGNAQEEIDALDIRLESAEDDISTIGSAVTTLQESVATKLQRVLLWQNPNIDTPFAAQEISVNAKKDDLMIIVYLDDKTDEFYIYSDDTSDIITTTAEKINSRMRGSATKHTCLYRYSTYDPSTKILEFQDCYVGNFEDDGDDWEVNNIRLVPSYIFAIRAE